MPLDVTQNLSMEQFADMYAKFAIPAASRHMKITKEHHKAVGNFRIRFLLDSEPPATHTPVNGTLSPDKRFIREFGQSLSTFFILEQLDQRIIVEKNVNDRLIALIGNGLAPHLFAVADLAGTGTEVVYTHYSMGEALSKPDRTLLANRPCLWIRLASLGKWLEIQYVPLEGYLSVKH